MGPGGLSSRCSAGRAPAHSSPAQSHPQPPLPLGSLAKAWTTGVPRGGGSPTPSVRPLQDVTSPCAGRLAPGQCTALGTCFPLLRPIGRGRETRPRGAGPTASCPAGAIPRWPVGVMVRPSGIMVPTCLGPGVLAPCSSSEGRECSLLRSRSAGNGRTQRKRVGGLAAGPATWKLSPPTHPSLPTVGASRAGPGGGALSRPEMPFPRHQGCLGGTHSESSLVSPTL